jgi:hypothetical protein
MFKFTIISVAVAALSGSALAGPILNLQITVDGSKSTTLQEGQLTPLNDYSYAGSVGDGYPVTSWIVGWDLASKSDSSSFVTNGFTIANLGSATKRFNIVLDVPNALATTGQWKFSGNLGGTLTSNSSSASTISSIGANPIWQGLRDGVSPGVNSQLLSSFTFSSPGSVSTLIPLSTITPYNALSTAGSSLGYQFQFDLSAKSTVSFGGVWAATVPAPGALALLGFTGVIMKRRRRFN